MIQQIERGEFFTFGSLALFPVFEQLLN